jgi:hypothetical protein
MLDQADCTTATGFGGILSEVLRVQTDAAKLGGSMAASVAAEEAIVEVFHGMLDESGLKIPEMLRRPVVREYIEPLGISILVHAAVLIWPNLPMAKTLRRAAYLASASKWEEVSKPLFRLATRFATRLVAKLRSNPATAELVESANG